MPDHFNVYGKRCVARVQHYERKVLYCPKGKPARKRRDHVGRFVQRGHSSKVRHTNRGAADQINVFVLKFEQSSLHPDAFAALA